MRGIDHPHRDRARANDGEVIAGQGSFLEARMRPAADHDKRGWLLCDEFQDGIGHGFGRSDVAVRDHAGGLRVLQHFLERMPAAPQQFPAHSPYPVSICGQHWRQARFVQQTPYAEVVTQRLGNFPGTSHQVPVRHRGSIDDEYLFVSHCIFDNRFPVNKGARTAPVTQSGHRCVMTPFSGMGGKNAEKITGSVQALQNSRRRSIRRAAATEGVSCRYSAALIISSAICPVIG